jgi:hypothetical protein
MVDFEKEIREGLFWHITLNWHWYGLGAVGIVAGIFIFFATH